MAKMRIETEPQVDMALRSLRPEEQRMVLGWFDQLKNWKTDLRLRTLAKSLDSDNTFVLKTPDDLLIFFKQDAQTVRVLDIAKQSILTRAGFGSE